MVRKITKDHLQKMTEGRMLWWGTATEKEKAAHGLKLSKAIKKSKRRSQKEKELHLNRDNAAKDEIALLKDDLKLEKNRNSILIAKLQEVKLQDGVREEVILFSKGMEQKLHKRDGYGGWKHLPIPYIKEKLKGEINELLVAISYETSAEVMSECIDVANYAMFLWDIMRTGDPRKESTLVGRTKDQGRS